MLHWRSQRVEETNSMPILWEGKSETGDVIRKEDSIIDSNHYHQFSRAVACSFNIPSSRFWGKPQSSHYRYYCRVISSFSRKVVDGFSRWNHNGKAGMLMTWENNHKGGKGPLAKLVKGKKWKTRGALRTWDVLFVSMINCSSSDDDDIASKRRVNSAILLQLLSDQFCSLSSSRITRFTADEQMVHPKGCLIQYHISIFASLSNFFARLCLICVPARRNI